ncbi:flavodoxin family protein [Vibrio parahaemolyticus]|uniref:flavodoxin family protein n=2 Tax=Vibrio parahaemolyticus TaxID=670 RepID=UPI00193DEF5A|nr:flavodoxin family protein [Vibrio parahaemolyticus]EJG0939058.1 flavodoxin family protein [Vibrio parahaemolyticus O1]EJB8451645.1 flavodoxin family protein [Vibrio parahaemolyticus]EJG0943096.1 flavodoxin family protein [Vibrio parahaemolyticus O1]MBM4878827.1 flavodoxin family protein [Vibrio parahaemolyticus]HAS6889455.1 flavodoxin family protein [Vibrio parahaemolyticus]
MSKIAIIYFSKTDVTGQLARAIAAGVEQQGIKQQGECEILSHRIEGSEIIEGRFVNPNLMDELAEYDAIIFGSPTYMGGVAAQFKAFADASSESWYHQKWANKVAAGFTSGGALNGDQSCTLQYLQTFAYQHGMMWVGLDKISNSGEQNLNRYGVQGGIVAQGGEDGQLHASDVATAEYLGKRIAMLVDKLSTR